MLYGVFLHRYSDIYSKGKGEIIMDIRARLEGIRQEDNRILRWNLYLTPVTKPGTFARSNRWSASINRVTGEIVFDRNGLYVRTSIATLAADSSSMDEHEKAVVEIFYALLQRYPEDEYVAISMDFEIKDDKLYQYLLNPILTLNIQPFYRR